MPEMVVPSSLIEKIVTRCLNWVQIKKVIVYDPGNKKTPQKPWGWLVGLIITLVLLIGLSILSFIMWRRGREIAKLKHQQDVDREKREQLIARRKIEGLENKKTQINSEIKEIAESIVDGEERIIALEVKRQQIHEKINVITTWDKVHDALELLRKND